MLPLAQAGLTTPAVAGPGCNEGLGVTRRTVDYDKREATDMRIRSIEVESWRHFEGIRIQPPEDAPIVCLVGGNGTGKSQILELIAACAQRIGLSSGYESSRRSPFDEQSAFKVVFSLAVGGVPPLDHAQNFPGVLGEQWAHWDRTLTLKKTQQGEQQPRAGGVADEHAARFASHVVNLIQQSTHVHYLSLDADRAYPRIQVGTNEIGQAFEREWDTSSKQSSFRTTKNLYEEWFRYLLGKENQENNLHIRSIRLARSEGRDEPVFVDQFEGYKQSLRSVLPHLLFLGVNPQKREIHFDSTGTALTFDQLSGGEREIAFLVGQIERFSLRRGLLLVDEPELHLNYDLLRAWIGYLKSSVENGQIWLATHSLEVVEVTGQDATVLLQRDPEIRKVNSASALSTQPVVSTLSRAVGSPAFSIGSLAFVLIEGEEEIGERERFRLLCDVPAHVRFLEAGSCKEVVRRVEHLRQLAEVSGQRLRIGGVIDGDWRSAAERGLFEGLGLHVLAVHEVENFFLHPGTLQTLSQEMGRDPSEIEALTREASDARAGSWIFQAARTDRAFVEYPEVLPATRECFHGMAWSDFTDVEAACQRIVATMINLDAQQQALLQRHLVARANIYARRREGEAWRLCEGKEVFRSLVPRLGFVEEDAAERAISALWRRRPEVAPNELQALRQYVGQL